MMQNSRPLSLKCDQGRVVGGAQAEDDLVHRRALDLRVHPAGPAVMARPEYPSIGLRVWRSVLPKFERSTSQSLVETLCEV